MRPPGGISYSPRGTPPQQEKLQRIVWIKGVILFSILSLLWGCATRRGLPMEMCMSLLLTKMSKTCYESVVSSFSYFSTQPSAPHSQHFLPVLVVVVFCSNGKDHSVINRSHLELCFSSTLPAKNPRRNQR